MFLSLLQFAIFMNRCSDRDSKEIQSRRSGPHSISLPVVRRIANMNHGGSLRRAGGYWWRAGRSDQIWIAATIRKSLFAKFAESLSKADGRASQLLHREWNDTALAGLTPPNNTVRLGIVATAIVSNADPPEWFRRRLLPDGTEPHSQFINRKLGNQSATTPASRC